MKLTSITPMAQPGTINDASLRPYDDGTARSLSNIARIAGNVAGIDKETAGINAHAAQEAARTMGIRGQAYNRIAQGLNDIGNVIMKQAEEQDAVNATAASNEYTKRVNELLYNQEDGLMNTKMQGAAGITGRFEEQEKKIRAEVGKQFRFNTKKGQVAFQNLANNSAAQRYEMVRRHQTQQYEAYKDVQFGEAVNLCAQTAADSYIMPGIVENNIQEAMKLTGARLFNQGPEVVKAAQRKVAGQIAQQVINRAYANGDMAAAETFIEKYGNVMDPAALTNFSKAVYQNRLRMITRDTAESLVAKYGTNLVALRDAIYNRGEGGSGYDGNKAVEWMKRQAADGTIWGVNTCTKGVNAALEAGGGLPGNTWAPTNWDDAKKAGMAFKDRSQLQSGDIVYWWKPGSDKNADDTSHVGIYDAETGKVYQSGTSGFRAIDLDSYSVTGFARPQGRGMTREQQDALYDACVRKVSQDKALRNQQIDASFDDVDKQLMALHDAGNVNYEDYMKLATQFTDPELRKKANAAAQYWWRLTAKPADGSGSGSGSGGGGKGGLAIGVMHGLEETLRNNNFDNESDWSYFVMQYNPNKSEYEKLMNLYHQKNKGEGIFKYKWEGLKEWFKKTNKFPKDLENVYWREAEGYAIDEINRFWEENHREPTVKEVQGFLLDSLISVKFGEVDSGKFYVPNEAVSLRRGQLSARGIQGTRRFAYQDGSVSDMTELDYGGGRKEIVNPERLKDMFATETGTSDRYTY